MELFRRIVGHVPPKTFVGFALGALAYFLQLFLGIDARAALPVLTDAILRFADSAAYLISVGMSLVGMIQLALKHDALIHSTPAPGSGGAATTPAPVASGAARGFAQTRLLVGVASIAMAVLGVLSFGGCASETASLTTIQGQTAATVDANPGIQQGQTVTASNASVGAVVNLINGNALTLSLPAPITATATATFKNTLSMQLAQDGAMLKTYGQDIGNVLAAIAPKIKAAAGNLNTVTQLVQQATSAAGLTPYTPSQSSLYTKIEKILTEVSADAGLVDTVIAGIQQTGTVANVTAGSN